MQETIESRLVRIRKIMGKRQAQFAASLGITQGALSQLERGRINISFEVLRKLFEVYRVNANFVLDGQGQMFLNSPSDASATPSGKLTPDAEIILVSEEAAASYPENYQNPEFLQSLGIYRIPGFDKGNFRMFYVKGDSMEPVLFDGELMITELVTNIRFVTEGNLFVILHKEGIMVKRLYHSEKENSLITIASDNPTYPSFTIPAEQILELWEVRSKISTKFLEDKQQDQRVGELEERIKNLEIQMKQLKNRYEKPEED